MLDDPSRFLFAFCSLEAAFQTHARFFVWVRLLQRTEERDQLLDVIQVGSQCQEFCFRSQFAWMFWIKSNTCEVMANP
jgi:hypothetical protein